VQAGFDHAIAYATSGLFWWAVPIAVLVPLLAILIKEVPLRASASPAARTAPTGRGGADAPVDGEEPVVVS
jgi:hypothetical protein